MSSNTICVLTFKRALLVNHIVRVADVLYMFESLLLTA